MGAVHIAGIILYYQSHNKSSPETKNNTQKEMPIRDNFLGSEVEDGIANPTINGNSNNHQNSGDDELIL
jgi:hypothetical protein